MLIKNGTLIDYNTEKKADVRIENGKITEISENLKELPREKVIDAENRFVLPGLIDINFHINAVASKKDESFDEAVKSARKGGITTLLLSPDCTPNINDEVASSFVLSKAQLEGFDNILISGNGTKEGHLNNISTLFKSGVTAITIDSEISSNMIRRVLEYTKTRKAPLIVNPKNGSLESSGVIHDGEVSSKMGLPSLPAFAESSEIAKISAIAKSLQSSVIFNYVTSKESIEVVKFAKESGFVYSAVPLANLLLTDENCKSFNSVYKTFPPLRTESDKKALINALKEKTIDVVSSNHRGVSNTGKDMPFELAKDGIAVSAIYLPLMYSKLVGNSLLDMHEMLYASSKRPAELLGLNKGAIEVGLDGDIIIFDPNGAIDADKKLFHSKAIGNITNYKESLKGSVEKVIVSGEEVLY